MMFVSVTVSTYASDCDGHNRSRPELEKASRNGRSVVSKGLIIGCPCHPLTVAIPDIPDVSLTVRAMARRARLECPLDGLTTRRSALTTRRQVILRIEGYLFPSGDTGGVKQKRPAFVRRTCAELSEGGQVICMAVQPTTEMRPDTRESGTGTAGLN